MVLKVTGHHSAVTETGAATRTALWGVVAVIGSVVYLATSLHNGWVPHDTGQLGQTAERVLNGEIQHRDFDEPYSGGLGHLHALVFRATGIRAEAMRWTLLVYSGLFVAAIYIISVRVTVAWAAAMVAFLCASLTLPIYAASMPSWYNLFFTVFGVLALLQHLDTGQRRWLFWAGCCAGCSLVIKITGLYFVATALLYVAYQQTLRTDASVPQGRAYATLVIIGCGAFALLGLAFSRSDQPLVHLAHFTIPMMAIAGCLAWQQWQHPGGTLLSQLRSVARDLLPLVAGIASVVSLLLVPYMVTGSLGDLYRGLFVLPAARLQHVALAPPDLKWMYLSLPLTGLLIVGMFHIAKQLNKPAALSGAILVCVAIFFASASVSGYFYLFQAVRNQIPLMTLMGMSILASKLPLKNRPAIFLIVTATALGSLVQYPYAYGTYFFYAAPLLVITILYIVANQPFAPKPVFVSLLALSLSLAVFRIPQPDPRLMNGFYAPTFPTAKLNLTRCNLTVYQEDARVYQELIELIQTHSPPGGYIYAAPDCPEVYFLSARRNPTRTLYDLFDACQIDRQLKLIEFLELQNISVLVINHNPAFSAALQKEELELLHERYPQCRVIRGARAPGQSPTALFTVFWRSLAANHGHTPDS
jgi:hypothetical protein